MIHHLYHFYMKCLSTATRYIQIFSDQFLQNLACIKPKKTLLIRKFVWQMFTSEEIHSFLVLKWNFHVWKTKPASDILQNLYDFCFWYSEIIIQFFFKSDRKVEDFVLKSKTCKWETLALSVSFSFFCLPRCYHKVTLFAIKM